MGVLLKRGTSGFGCSQTIYAVRLILSKPTHKALGVSGSKIIAMAEKWRYSYSLSWKAGATFGKGSNIACAT
jgi:hypothetical protein